MTDQDIVIAAIEEAQHILAEYIEPGPYARLPDVTIDRLLSVLDRRDVVSVEPPRDGVRIAHSKIKRKVFLTFGDFTRPDDHNFGRPGTNVAALRFTQRRGSPSRDILDRRPRLPPGWGRHFEEY
jgi:hypothetical protein